MTPLVAPFRALRPRPERAADVIAPPYDVVDADEARATAHGRPFCFLHVSRPEIDLPPGTDPYSDAVYARGAATLAALVESGVLVREDAPSFYVYRMTTAMETGPGASTQGARPRRHVQTGIAGVASVRAYEEGRIVKHELTRPDKEDDRVRNIDALNAQTGPVLAAYRSNEGLRSLIDAATRAPPLIDVEGPNGVTHTLWRVAAPDDVADLAGALDSLDRVYIADGHHRSAAAARVAHQRRATSGAGDASHERFLMVAFPHDEMRILPYHRAVADLNGLSPDDLVARLAAEFRVERLEGRAEPRAPRRFGMYLGGAWYALEPRAGVPPDDPVARLDVSLLQDRVIRPLLGIEDPRTDPRIAFVGGVRGLGALERLVDDGRAAVAFALHPTTMEQLIAVAEAGRLMPPKSTWFEPKLADGLLTHVLD